MINVIIYKYTKIMKYVLNYPKIFVKILFLLSFLTHFTKKFREIKDDHLLNFIAYNLFIIISAKMIYKIVKIE